MKKYRLYNDVLGWLCFVVAAFTYLMTVEPTASFWDCPEFISQGVKLEVGHPPGNPIFMLAARFFVNFAGGDMTKAALMVNSMSALLSAGTILLLFWTITHLVKRLIVKDDAKEISLTKMLVIFGSGLCGALAYTWSDTFWFSAVEGEVYAFSSFCTALVFWLILKWENRADQPHSDRYLIFIAYIIGVSIAVHLLNLLCIPAIVLVVYYRKFKETTATGSLIALAIAGAIVALILFGLVPGFIEVAQYFELFFVNTLGMGYNIGVLVYTVLFIAVMIWSVRSLYKQKSANAIRWSFLAAILLSGIPFIGSSLWIPVVLLGTLAIWLWGAKKLPVRILTVVSLSVLVIFVGYSSYALLLIRSHANPPMNQNAPDNVFSLGSYLSREQYGETPLLYGHTFKSSVMYQLQPDGYNYDILRRPGKTVYNKGVKTSPDQPDSYVAKQEEFKYEMTPKMLFPRMYSTAGSHPQAYLEWINATEDDLPTVDTPVVVDADGNAVQSMAMKRPSYLQNLRYFFNYQVNYMYWRYFMWNFAGRQNDLAGEGQANRGNWISGIPVIDNYRLGDQSLLPDEYGKGNKGHNVFYMLPLLLGIIGLSWQAFRSKRGIEQFWVIFFFFFMTGLAIVLYLNQPPLQPRERDYAFAGSFYAFAIWIGMGVAGLWTLVNWLLNNPEAVREGVSLPKNGKTDPAKSRKTALAVACGTLAVGLLVPAQMVSQTWDDHDRSGRYTTRDFGMNYLSSVAPNGIIFTNGDNDTFPLWYAQEVEGYRTDVRVVNLSYLTTDWYANQMKVATDGAAGLKFSAQPADYAYDRLQFSYYDPDNMVTDTVNVFTSLDDLYHNPEATWKGARVMRMPYMYIPSNAEAAAKAGVISERELPAAEETIDIALYRDPKNPVGGATLSQALSIDMIATQAKEGWSRPAYFAMTVPDEYYLSLSPYMRNTGLAYQVSPLLNPDGSRETWIDTDKMYANITEKFRWGGLDKVGEKGDIYLDETVRRMVTTHRTAMADLAMALYVEGIEALDSVGGRKPDAVYAADRFTKAARILDMIEEKLPVRVSPYSIQTGYQIADAYLRLAAETGDENLFDKGMKITLGEIDRYAAYLPYFNELRRTLPGSGFSGLSPADRYVPTYLYLLLQLYAEEGGDLNALSESLAKKGVNLDDLEAYLPNR
ncbi:MAG: DUF2723 domain-containing protein [Muribaculaceae bacterium]|nr:DUF2723 domain-containing protein [Muribaculaceae bacterium]